MTLFTFFILLPSAFSGNVHNCIMITTKVFATITAVNILSNTTKWNAVTGALKKFFIPDIFILVLDITIKYIVMLGDFSLEMFYALKLRSVGKNTVKHKSISGIAGTIFIKSKEMAEDMYSAMECRGYTGEYRSKSKDAFSWRDGASVLYSALIVFVFIYFEKVQG
jgi:cobalt/nickel transport system permease protein